MNIIKRIKRYFFPTFTEWLDETRVGVRLSTLEELKESLQNKINETKEYDQLAALCLSFGQALKVRLPKFNSQNTSSRKAKE